MGKKLLFFTSRTPLKPVSGRETSLYYYIKYLNKMYNYDIVVITFAQKNEVIEDPNGYIQKIYNVEAPSKVKLLFNFFDMLLIKRLPIQVALFYSSKIQKRVNDIINTERPNIVMADMVRTSEYLKSFNGKKIFDMDDMLSVRYKRQLGSKGDIVNPFGAYSRKLPNFIGKILDHNIIKRKILNYEYKTLEKYEVEVSKVYDVVVLVSDIESNSLNKKLESLKAITVSTGVNCKYFSEPSVEIKDNLISFLGVYSAPHNEDAILYFYDKIFPTIKRYNQNVILRLVGGNVTDSIKNLQNDKCIEITGRVDDVRKYIKESRVFIAPLRFGSGIKTKILEAMAMGVPVVTTSVGAEGMNAENYKDIIIEDDEEKFAQAVLKLSNDDKLYNLISVNGKKFVVNNYDWNVKMMAWEKVFNLLYRG